MLSIVRRTVRDNRRGLIWWGIGLVIFTGINVLIYPSFKDSTGLDKLLQESPDLYKAFAGNITSFTSPDGYLNSQVFFLMAPVMFSIYTILAGSFAIAGEEGKRTLPLLLATPQSRAQVVVGKWLAMVLMTTLLAVLFLVVMIATCAAVNLDIGTDRLAEATLNLDLLAIAFGTLALALGAALGKRGAAGGITGAVVVGSYLINSLALSISSLQPYQKLSLFYHYSGGDPLAHGLQAGHAVVLAVVSLALLTGGTLIFQRRDISV